MPNKLAEIRLRFRFHEDDQYDGEWIYDEAAIARLPLRELIAIEATIGMSISIMRFRLRGDYIDAALAATWLARKLGGIEEEDFGEYAPMVPLMDWEVLPPAQGDDAGPPAPQAPQSAGASTSSTSGEQPPL